MNDGRDASEATTGEIEEPLYWGEVVEVSDVHVKIRLPRDNHSTGVVGTHVKVFLDEKPLLTAWGFEFEWRDSGSQPLQYRKVGGCGHDWVRVDFDNPLVAAVKALDGGR